MAELLKTNGHDSYPASDQIWVCASVHSMISPTTTDVSSTFPPDQASSSGKHGKQWKETYIAQCQHLVTCSRELSCLFRHRMKYIFKFGRSIIYIPSLLDLLSIVACTWDQMRQLQGCPSSKPLPIGVSKNCPFTQSDFACDSLTMRCAALRSSQRFCVCASASPLGFQCHNCHNSTSYCQLLPVTLVIFVILVILHAGSMPAISCRLAFIKYCAGMGEKWFAVGAGRISLQIWERRSKTARQT